MSDTRMKCETCKALLSRYIEAELSPAEKENIEAHLSACRQCTDELQVFFEVLALVRGLPLVSPPENACAQVLETVKAQAASVHTQYFWEETQEGGKIATFIREPDLQIAAAQSGTETLRSFRQILRQFNGTWWSFYAEANP